MLEKIKSNWVKSLLMLLILTITIGFVPMQSQAAPKLNKKKATIYVGKTVKLKVKGTSKKVKWSSTKKSVCKVNQKGLVTGKKKGTAYIKAKVGKKTLKCKVKVKKKSTKTQLTTQPASGLSITGASNILAKGGTMQLQVNFLPANARQEAVKWYSDATSVATVENGLVTAKKNGTAKISVWLASNENIYATYTITVKDITAYYETQYSADGGDLLLSDNNAKTSVSFTLSDMLPDVKVHVLDANKNIIRTYNAGTVGTSTPYTCTWDLYNSNGVRVPEGSYCFRVSAAGADIDLDYFKVYARSEFGSGNGSPSSPYPVSNLEQLALVANHNGACFIQTADIDANLTEVAPLFSPDVPFTGTYDGGNHTIKNVSNNISGNATSIFRAVGESGTVQNLTVEGGFFNGTYNVSALVGINYGTIVNCKVENCNIIATDGRSGVLVGYNGGTIKNCSTNGNTIKTTKGDAGGLCGYSCGNITNCTATSNSVSLSANDKSAGGLIGANSGNVVGCSVKMSDMNIKQVTYYYSGNNAGGITGWNSGSVANCDVKECTFSYEDNDDDLGGIIGHNTGNNTNNTYVGTLNQVGKE